MAAAPHDVPPDASPSTPDGAAVVGDGDGVGVGDGVGDGDGAGGVGDGDGRSVVMADVARRAEVSLMTVSRVVNGTGSVRPETRQRVERAMALLDYRPNVAARALVTGRSGVLGVIGFNTTLFGPASTLFSFQEAARDAGYFVTVDSVRSLDPDVVRSVVQRLRAQGVEGVLVMAPHEAALATLVALPRDLPAVAVHTSEAAPIASVTIDQQGGASLATRHLLDEGHETVVHLAGPDDWVEGVGRRRGWQQVLDESGRDVPEVLVGDWSPASGHALGATLLARSEVTAVFVANDAMALGLYRAVSEHGLRIPEDLSVVGFDDIPESAFFAPPLTTVRQAFDEVGRRSVASLLDQIAGGDGPDATVVPATLVTRASTCGNGSAGEPTRPTGPTTLQGVARARDTG